MIDISKQKNTKKLNLNRKDNVVVSPYLKINRTHNMNPFYKKEEVEHTFDDHLKLVKDKYPKYKNQFQYHFRLFNHLRVICFRQSCLRATTFLDINEIETGNGYIMVPEKEIKIVASFSRTYHILTRQS